MKSLREEWQFIRRHPWDFVRVVFEAVGFLVLVSLFGIGIWIGSMVVVRFLR